MSPVAGVDSRRGLSEAIDYARDGDTLVVWKLDRLGRSLKHLLWVVNGLAARKIGFQSLRENMDNNPGEVIHAYASALGPVAPIPDPGEPAGAAPLSVFT